MMQAERTRGLPMFASTGVNRAGGFRARRGSGAGKKGQNITESNPKGARRTAQRTLTAATAGGDDYGLRSSLHRGGQEGGQQRPGASTGQAQDRGTAQDQAQVFGRHNGSRGPGGNSGSGRGDQNRERSRADTKQMGRAYSKLKPNPASTGERPSTVEQETQWDGRESEESGRKLTSTKEHRKSRSALDVQDLGQDMEVRSGESRPHFRRGKGNQQFQVNRIEASYLSAGNQAGGGEESSQSRDRSQTETIPTREARSGFGGAGRADTAGTPSNALSGRQRKSNLRGNSSDQPGLDPELVKFYKAFQNKQKITRTVWKTIRLAGTDFQGDFVKLQKAGEELGQTLERAEVELEQKAMQQVCEAAAGLDAAAMPEPQEPTYLHQIELLDLQKEASAATSGVRSKHLSATPADMNITPQYEGRNQPSELEQTEAAQLRLSKCNATAPAESRQEPPAGRRYPVAADSSKGLRPPAAVTTETDQVESGASPKSAMMGNGRPRDPRMRSAQGEGGRFATFALSQGAITMTKLEQDGNEELDSPLTPMNDSRGLTEPKLEQVPARPERLKHSIKTLPSTYSKQAGQSNQYQAVAPNVRMLVGDVIGDVAPATVEVPICCYTQDALNGGNGASQHQHMVISEEQSRMMDSQSQRTAEILGSEAQAAVSVAAGVLQGQINRPLLAKKALISTTLQRQAVERLIEAKREQAQRSLASAASVPGSSLDNDIHGQQPAKISDKEQMIFNILLNSQLGSRLGQVATANIDLLHSGEIMAMLEQGKTQSSRIPPYVFEKFPEAVRDAIEQAADQERLQDRPQSPGFYSRVKQGAHQVLAKRCRTQTKERKAKQVQLLTQKWQIEKPLQVTVQLARAPQSASKQRQQHRNGNSQTTQQISADPKGQEDLVQQQAEPSRPSNGARKHTQRKLEVDITKAQADTANEPGLSRSPGTFDAFSPQSLMMVSQASKHGPRFPADCIDEASGMGFASKGTLKGTLGITGKSYDPGLKATKLQSFFSADNLNNDRFAEADPGQPQLQLLSQHSNVASQTVTGAGPANQPQPPATLPGHHHFNASAKSMVTMHSDPDGTKFIHKGMYHHQNSRVSRELKEGESPDHGAPASSLAFPIQFGEENLKALNSLEGQQHGKKVLEVDEDVRDGEDIESPAAGMRTALVVDAGALDGGRDYIENEAEGTALRAEELASQSDRKEEEKDLVLVELEAGADAHAEASGGESQDEKPNNQSLSNNKQEDPAQSPSGKPTPAPLKPRADERATALGRKLSHASGRKARAPAQPSKLDKIVHSAAPTARGDKDERPSTNDSKGPVSRLGQRLAPNATLDGVRGQSAASGYGTKQVERSRSNRQAGGYQIQRQVVQQHQGGNLKLSNQDLPGARRAPAASGDGSATTNVNQSAMQHRYAMLQHQINQGGSTEPHARPMLNTVTSGYTGAMFSGRRELPGNHRQTHRLNLEFQGSEMNTNVNSSYVIRSGSGKNELLRLLGAKSKNSGHKNSAMKNQKHKTQTSAPKPAEKKMQKLESTWFEADGASNQNEEEESYKPHWGNNREQESGGARRTTLMRGSGPTPSNIQGAALKQQLLQKTRTSESVNQKDMLRHLLSGVALPDRSIPDDCREVHLDGTALASNLTNVDSLIDVHIGAGPASIMSANLKKNFLPADPHNQVNQIHDLNRTLIKINDQTKSSNLSGFFGQGLGRRHAARPKSSTNNDFRAYTRFIPELQNPKLEQTLPNSTLPSPARHKTMEAAPFIDASQLLTFANQPLEQPKTLPRSNFSSEQQVNDYMNGQGSSDWQQSRGQAPRMPAHQQFFHSQQMMSSKLSERLRTAGGSGYMLAQQMKGVVRFNSKDLSRIRLLQKQKKRPRPELNIDTNCSSGQDYHAVNSKSSKARYGHPGSAKQEPSLHSQEIRIEQDKIINTKNAILEARSSRRNE